MQKISDSICLDFDDVLIEPQRTSLSSRSVANLERTFNFLYSPRSLTCVPIMCANMSFSSFSIAKELTKYKIITCLHKYHTVEQLSEYFADSNNSIDYTWISIGYKKSDLNNLIEFKKRTNIQPNICIDVPNGHMDVFVKYCKSVRDEFPESIIMAGNITNTSSCQELLTYGGVDICKIGIGGGCFVVGTKIITKNGKKNIEKITIGDEVKTHKNRYKKVIGTKTRLETNTIIDINGICCTPNHQFYVVAKSDVHLINNSNVEMYAKWIPAADLSENYLLVKYQE